LQIFDIVLSLFTQRVWHCCICCARGRSLYIKSAKKAMGFCHWWIHHEWFTVRKVNQLLACYLLLLSIDWSWFIISTNQLQTCRIYGIYNAFFILSVMHMVTFYFYQLTLNSLLISCSLL